MKNVAILMLACSAPASPMGKQEQAIPLMNKAKDIHVISDRMESLPAFFQRQPILVGGLLGTELQACLEAKKPREKMFINYASFNDDRSKESLFGAFITLAPVSEPVAKLLKERGKGTVTLILRRDPKNAELYHLVGWTERTSVGFFAGTKVKAPDDFSQADLRMKK